MNHFYDKKNQEDHELNSEKITEALSKIESDFELKPTIAQLGKLTGLHRNTLRNREWPVRELERIRTSRQSNSTNKEPSEPTGGGSFESLKMEAAYWFAKVLDLEKRVSQTTESLKYMTESRDFYAKNYEEEKARNKILSDQNERLVDLINIRDLKSDETIS